jgi:hypothetical protein
MENETHQTSEGYMQEFVTEAQYTPQSIPEYQHNRYVEALPGIWGSPKEFFTAMTRIPVASIEERNLPTQQLLHFNSRLHDFYIPNSTHFHVQSEVDVMIRQGYVRAATIISPTRRKVNGQKYGIADGHDTTVRTLVLLGNSGCGKTKLITEILSRYPRLILHSEYDGRACLEYQIPWLKVEIPPSADIKNLCISICRAIDDLFPNAEPTYQYAAKTAAKRQIDYVNKLLLRHKVGILVIDEIQNIQHLTNSATNAMLDFLLQLQNTIATPMVWVGTHEAEKMLSGTLKYARRASSCVYIKPYENDIQWANFIKSLIKISVTDTEYSDELADSLYEKAHGMPATAIALFEAAQTRAILKGQKRVTPELISIVAKDSLHLLRPALNAMSKKDIAKLRQYPDLPQVSDIFTRPSIAEPQKEQKSSLSDETIEFIEKRARIESRVHALGISHKVCRAAADKIYQGTNVFRSESELTLDIRDAALQIIKAENNLHEIPQDKIRPIRRFTQLEAKQDFNKVVERYADELIDKPE